MKINLSFITFLSIVFFCTGAAANSETPAVNLPVMEKLQGQMPLLNEKAEENPSPEIKALNTYPFTKRYGAEKGEVTIYKTTDPATQTDMTTEWVNGKLYRHVVEIKNRATLEVKMQEIYYQAEGAPFPPGPQHPKLSVFKKLWTRAVETKVIDNEIFEWNQDKRGKIIQKFRDSFEKPKFPSDSLP